MQSLIPLWKEPRLLGEMANSRSEAGKAQGESALLYQKPEKDVYEDSRVCTDSHGT